MDNPTLVIPWPPRQCHHLALLEVPKPPRSSTKKSSVGLFWPITDKSVSVYFKWELRRNCYLWHLCVRKASSVCHADQFSELLRKEDSEKKEKQREARRVISLKARHWLNHFSWNRHITKTVIAITLFANNWLFSLGAKMWRTAIQGFATCAG